MAPREAAALVAMTRASVFSAVGFLLPLDAIGSSLIPAAAEAAMLERGENDAVLVLPDARTFWVIELVETL